MTTFQKLQIRIKHELGIDISQPKRLYPGYWQRANGAFVWTAYYVIDDRIQPIDIGSTYPASRLVAHKGKLIITSNNEIIPD